MAFAAPPMHVAASMVYVAYGVQQSCVPACVGVNVIISVLSYLVSTFMPVGPNGLSGFTRNPSRHLIRIIGMIRIIRLSK